MAFRMSPEERRLTADEYAGLPDEPGWRVELSCGLLVREPQPGAEHGWIARTLDRALARAAEPAHGIVLRDTGFQLSTEPTTVRAPDVAFVATTRLPAALPSGFWLLAPDVAVEVVSPSNTLAGMQRKVLEYLDAGTRLVWVIEPRSRTVTEYRSSSEVRVLREPDMLEAGNVVPDFQLPVAELFVYPLNAPPT